MSNVTLYVCVAGSVFSSLGLNPAAGYSSALSNGYSAAAAGYPGYGGQAGYGCLAPYPTGVVPSSFSSMSAAAYTGQVPT